MTDADVDGAHIRTLLMTFFYRYMPQLIEAGHIYIAQPPLYKLRKGQTDVYLKNEEELYDRLISLVMKDITVTSVSGGGNIPEGQLLELFQEIRQSLPLIESLPHKEVSEAMLLLPKFLDYCGGHTAINKDVADDLMDILRKVNLGESVSYEWASDTQLMVRYLLQGSRVEKVLDISILKQKLGKHALRRFSNFSKIFVAGIEMKYKALPSHTYHLPSKLLASVLENAKNNVYIQRFKGLGEMNPEQLWETTLNPENRLLLQLKVQNADIAEEVFSTLMGDVVEPRKAFIYENALNVKSIDA